MIFKRFYRSNAHRLVLGRFGMAGEEFALRNAQAAMLDSALYADCAAATQNILLGIHGWGPEAFGMALR